MNDKLRVVDNLTMNGITHPVTFALNGSTPEITDSQGRVKIGRGATSPSANEVTIELNKLFSLNFRLV